VLAVQSGQRVNLIDLPHPTGKDLYRSTVDKVVNILSDATFVDAIYQIGSVRHPGISDIDLLLVVADDADSKEDPLARLSSTERYLFTHACFVVPISLAPELPRHVLLNGYRHLQGTDWRWTTDPETARRLELQTALEFLAKNVIDLYVQLTYGMLKVRVFLQHMKGVKVDIDLAGVEGGRLAVVLEHTTSLIDDWFTRPDSEDEIAQTAIELLPLLRDALADATTSQTLYAPFGEPIRFAKNIWLNRGAAIEMTHRGVRLPPIPRLEPRRQFNAHHRINRFRFSIPMTAAQAGSYHASRFEFLSRAKSFAATHLPAYSAPIPPLFYRAL
jgi:hypothetical protein